MKLEKPSVELQDADIDELNTNVNKINIGDAVLVNIYLFRMSKSRRKKRIKNQKVYLFLTNFTK